MAEAEPIVPFRGFLWCAVAAGLIPTLTLGGVALYMLALAIGLSTTPDGGSYLRFLLSIGGFLAASLYSYWRLLWLYAQARRPDIKLWLFSGLLLLLWLGWFAWGCCQSEGRIPSLEACLGLASFVCWAILLKRTY